MRGSVRLVVAEYMMASLLFFVSFLGTYHAGRYVDRVGARLPPLGEDLLLQTLPRFDVSSLFIWGFLAFVVFAAVTALIYERKRLPYLLWMYAMLILIRAVFVCLTPMGAPAGMISMEGVSLAGSIKGSITFSNDLFFSAHTAMPFLASLLFRRKWVRGVLLAFSLVLAACVLVGRFHYSIDVVAAYFITYGFVKAHRRILESRYLWWKMHWMRRDRVRQLKLERKERSSA